jgi:hypothetical protein
MFVSEAAAQAVFTRLAVLFEMFDDEEIEAGLTRIGSERRTRLATLVRRVEDAP